MGWQWADTRGTQFGLAQIQPQQDTLEQGSAACRELDVTAEGGAIQAEESEQALRLVYAEEEAFDDAAAAARTATRKAEALAHQVRGTASGVRSDVSALSARISSAMADPGW